MIIRNLIQKSFEVTTPFTGTHKIRETVAKHNAVVVIDDDRICGIVTATDMLVKQHKLVIDCIVPKPSVYSTNSITEVLDIMKATGFRILPVFDKESFVGLISYDDMIEQLSKIIDEQKTIIQSIAHDLKNPIASIMGLSSLLRNNIIKDENIELLDYTDKACIYASDIINDLLFVPELEGDQNERGAFEVTEMNTFLLECIDNMQTLANEKKINIVNALTAHNYIFPIHRSKLKRAISNLLSNGIKFTPENGSIVVSSSLEGNELLIKIKDSGIGIPLTTQPYIFNKFTKAKRLGTKGEKSIGMGLYITKQIVELHDGHLWFQSTEKTGTTFFIQLGKNQQN